MDLYIASRDDHTALKIGRSSTPHDRVKQLSKGHIFDTHLLALFENKGPMERFVHEELHEHRINNTEWFDCDLVKAKQITEIYSVRRVEALIQDIMRHIGCASESP